ncbi:MAG TPA: tetratricopeptide repeat protein, partial [Anaeromyxobacteraceae bacterium]|nr:tetratricopeptide repeat protein [Anaeromyxobacteraceae bacterium]
MRRLAAVLLAALAPAAALAAAPATGYTSCRQRAQGPAFEATPAAPATAARPLPADAKEGDAFEAAVRRFDDEARAYRGEIQSLVLKQFDERRRFLADNYEQAITDLEALERNERESAIARFEEFLAHYPDDPQFTPDAMFRLAELYYEKANDDFRLATEAYRDEAKRALAEGREPPPEPMKSYAPSIALYQRLITGFPDYRFTHGIYYLLAYCLGEMGQGVEAQVAYQTLIERFPDSPFVPEAWVRLGDWHFDEVQAESLPHAAQAFSKMYAFPEHPLFARAIYKLGWTYYRMDDFQNAVESFTRLLDHYVALSKKTGEKPSGEVWPEAVQYTAISFADERWGGVDKAKAFYAALGGRSYEAEVFTRLGDVFFEETKYAQAVEAFKVVLALQPTSPDAPRIQSKIVLAWNRDRRFDKEADERQALVRSFAEGTPWWEANKGDPDLVAQVRELSEKGLLRAAGFHHAQAQQYKADGKLEAAVAEYRVAATAYGDYLARFPHSKQAHELRYNYADCLYNALDFEKAARTYAQVRDEGADGSFVSESALSAVISWEGEVTRQERAGQLAKRPVLLSTDRHDKEPIAPEPVPEVLQSLVRDSDVFLSRMGGHDKAATIAYKAGEIFYTYNDFDEARCRFEEVVARWPASDVAQFSANLIIESYLSVKDWASVEDASARLQTLDVAKNPALNATLQKFKLGGRFNRAMQAMDAKRYEEAARLFTALVQEDPKHEFADKALYNAASCYEGARRFESALRMYERISAEYPASTLADEALFLVGFNAENTYDFEKAVERYRALVEKYQGSKHRKDALYNEARALENLQRYDAAAAAFAKYAKAYPDAEDAARTQFHAALIYEKTQDWRKETAALQEFNRRFGKSKEPELIVQSQLKIALAAKELGDDKGARAGYTATVAEFANRGLKPETHVRAAAAAAEARFRLAEYEFEKYDKIALPATTDAKKLKKALESKFAEAKRVAPLYDEVGKYKRPDWILAAFYRKAYLLERLAQTIYEAPIPPEYKKAGMEEYLAAYQDGLAQFAQPYEDQAVGVYVQAIEAARKLHVKNEWTKKIGESLARYRPREYPVLKEAKARMITEDVSPAPFADTPEGPTKRAPPAPPAEGQPAEEPPAAASG